MEEETTKIFNFFINWMNGLSPKYFQTIHMNDILVIENLFTPKIPLYDVDIVDGNAFWELARPSVQKYENFVRLLRYKNHLYYVSNIDADFLSFQCPTCDTFSNRLFNLMQHSIGCSERIKNVYPSKYINSEELFLKSWKPLVSSFQVNKGSSKFQQFSTVTRIVSRKKLSRI